MSDLSALKSLIATIIPSDLSNLISIFSYQGFNPDMVIQHFLKKKLEKNISDADFKSDITALICLGCIAGNYTPKNKEKRDDKGVAKADELFNRYELKMGSIGNDKKAVTLPRVLLSFPILTYKITMIVPARNFPGIMGSSVLPACMKSSVFPSLIPEEFGANSKNALLIAYCCFTCDQTKAINPDAKNTSVADIFQKQMAFVEIGNKSPEPSNVERTAVWKEIIPVLIANWSGISQVLNNFKQHVSNAYVVPAKFGTAVTEAPSATEVSTSFS